MSSMEALKGCMDHTGTRRVGYGGREREGRAEEAGCWFTVSPGPQRVRGLIQGALC